MAPTAPNKDKELSFMNETADDRAENLLKLQADALDRAQKALTNFKKDGASRKIGRLYYQTKITKFGKIVDEFESNHRELVTLVPTSDIHLHDYFKDDHASLFEDAQLEFITNVQGEYEAKFPENEPPKEDARIEHLKSHVQLPPITIPRISGAPTEWKAFHDIFKSMIHSNPNLPGSHKIQYLNGALSGEAKDVITGFQLCDDDYPKAWKALCNIYNDKPSVFMHIMNKFASMEPTTKEHPEALRGLMKDTSACLKSLDSVGVDSKQCDAIVIRKLPPATVAYWEQTRDRTQLPSFNTVQECIETRIRVASAIASVQWETKGSSSSDHRAETNHQNHQSKHQHQQSKRSKVSTYHSSAKPSSTPAASSSSNQSKTVGKKFSCPVCNGEGHPLRTCDKFLSMTPTERKATINKLQYCANCFAFNHQESKCKSTYTCFTCGGRHHSLLHVVKPTDSVSRFAAHALSASPTSTINVNTCNTHSESFSSSHVLLATAIVTVLDASGQPHSLRALIDQGSEANFITESALTALQLPKQAVQAVISGIGASSGQAKHITSFTIQSQHDQTFSITVEALVMGRITNLLPSNCFKPQRWDHVIDLMLADPSYHRTGRIDLVLGADVLAQIIMEGVRIDIAGSPIAQQTHLGWILSGRISNRTSPSTTVTSLHAQSNIESLMENFLSLESVEDASPMSTEEQWCEQFYVDTHQRDETGRFKVRLPFRFIFDPTTTSLGRSRDIAVKGLLHLERRFAQNPDLKRQYSDQINEYLTTGRMQPTTANEIDRDGNIRSAYLPHHAVIKESSTSTKLRVVFDASRKTTSGKSLNDMLVVGPTIQNDIVTIIINWRFHLVGCIADVQKMYLQVQENENDVEYQRIVWRNDPSEPIQDFAMNRLTFGTSSAPYIAIRSVNASRG